MKRIYITFQLFTIAIVFMACKSYLDEVPDRSLAVLTSVQQFQQLLDQQENYQTAPTIQEYGTDDFHWSYEVWQSRPPFIRNAYIWASGIYDEGGSTQDWWAPYSAIYYANVVLDGLSSLENVLDVTLYNDVKGHALFLRAYQHFLLQEVYGQPFRPETASSDLGIPLKLSPELDERLFRSTTADTYMQIITDLEEAAAWLSSDFQEFNKQRPSKAAAYAALSRVYLAMHDYGNALIYADKCLDVYNVLLHYDDLSPGNQFPFPDNIETIFATRQLGYSGFIASNTTVIDSILYQSYEEGDLRKNIFFRVDPNTGQPSINSMYSGVNSPFGGLAVDEVYLNRAECRARLGNLAGALDDINTLRQNRFPKGQYIPLQEPVGNDVLGTVLLERRRQLVFRGTRWMDLRRLNLDPERATVLRRILEGTEYLLPPNSPKYTYPIPPEEINLSKLIQNER